MRAFMKEIGGILLLCGRERERERRCKRRSKWVGVQVLLFVSEKDVKMETGKRTRERVRKIR